MLLTDQKLLGIVCLVQVEPFDWQATSVSASASSQRGTLCEKQINQTLLFRQSGLALKFVVLNF